MKTALQQFDDFYAQNFERLALSVHKLLRNSKKNTNQELASQTVTIKTTDGDYIAQKDSIKTIPNNSLLNPKDITSKALSKMRKRITRTDLPPLDNLEAYFRYTARNLIADHYRKNSQSNKALIRYNDYMIWLQNVLAKDKNVRNKISPLVSNGKELRQLLNKLFSATLGFDKNNNHCLAIILYDKNYLGLPSDKVMNSLKTKARNSLSMWCQRGILNAIEKIALTLDDGRLHKTPNNTDWNLLTKILHDNNLTLQKQAKDLTALQSSIPDFAAAVQKQQKELDMVLLEILMDIDMPKTPNILQRLLTFAKSPQYSKLSLTEGLKEQKVLSKERKRFINAKLPKLRFAIQLYFIALFLNAKKTTKNGTVTI